VRIEGAIRAALTITALAEIRNRDTATFSFTIVDVQYAPHDSLENKAELTAAWTNSRYLGGVQTCFLGIVPVPVLQ
jgi:hypothetical protein